jgi:putative ABC transport system permease protein
MQTLRLALRMLSRDWRAGELTVLIAALVLAVASMGTVGFFADRVKGALTRQANLLLGADVMISADRPLPPSFVAEAKTRGLVTSSALRFNSMVQREGAEGPPVLTTVKAVSAGYPLRGAIMLVDPQRSSGTRASGIPPPGEAWPEARLAQRLGLSPGDRSRSAKRR